MLSADEQLLQCALRDILPQAELATFALPTRPPLQLSLLNSTFPQWQLDQQQMLKVMNNPLYWIFCWASGRVLADYILSNPQLVAGRTVVDFGCGSGVLGIAAALAGAAEVIACDIDKMALGATRHNAALNGVTLNLCDDFNAIEGSVDLILAADVLYDPANIGWLQRFIERSPRVLLADSRVKDFNFPPYYFLAEAEASTLPDLEESREFRRVRIYQAEREIAGFTV